MKIPLALEFTDGSTKTITPSPMAIIGWERWSGRKMTDLASDAGGMAMGDMVRMAWEQARLEGLTEEDFEPWATTLADIDAADGSDPTSGGEDT